mmetsp:Transcript_58889/g.151424  ORF Transcript_58889/g.151424 Transcript_58889/m.151424 type:complete len:250 (+) Transcript_58889:687-1436(+)
MQCPDPHVLRRLHTSSLARCRRALASCRPPQGRRRGWAPAQHRRPEERRTGLLAEHEARVGTAIGDAVDLCELRRGPRQLGAVPGGLAPQRHAHGLAADALPLREGRHRALRPALRLAARGGAVADLQQGLRRAEPGAGRGVRCSGGTCGPAPGPGPAEVDAHLHGYGPGGHSGTFGADGHIHCVPPPHPASRRRSRAAGCASGKGLGLQDCQGGGARGHGCWRSGGLRPGRQGCRGSDAVHRIRDLPD